MGGYRSQRICKQCGVKFSIQGYWKVCKICREKYNLTKANQSIEENLQYYK